MGEWLMNSQYFITGGGRKTPNVLTRLNTEVDVVKKQAERGKL